MPKFVAMLRIKDGILFVKDWLNCFDKLVDEIVVLDNGSTDGSYELLAAHPKVTDIIRTEGYNEGRDKNLLYQRMRLRNPDWCIWVDVDEMFEPQLTRQHFEKLMQRKYVNKYGFRRFHFIDTENFAGSWFRLNYSAGHDRIMWRENSEGYFEDAILDSPVVKGIRGIKIPTSFRLKHLGYISKELVDKKAEIYRQVITPDKSQNIATMYLDKEKKIRWNDNRASMQVLGLNGLLNILLLRQYAFKAWSRTFGKMGSFFRKPMQTGNL